MWWLHLQRETEGGVSDRERTTTSGCFTLRDAIKNRFKQKPHQAVFNV